MMFRSIDPTVCSVSSGGVVLGLSIGECSVTVSKLGSGSYLHITSAPVVFSISKFGLSNTYLGSSITIKRRARVTTIEISLAPKYVGKHVVVEFVLKTHESINYHILGITHVNSVGQARLKTRHLIPLGAIVRTKIGSKVVAQRQ